MSYDYDALVADITESRRLAREAEEAAIGTKSEGGEPESSEAHAQSQLAVVEHLTTSVDRFETLSGHCPMTPLLWMQYALDASELVRMVSEEAPGKGVSNEALQTGLQLLELGLHEFPGSAVLRLHYVEVMMAWAGGRLGEDVQNDQTQDAVEECKTALEKAIEVLGDGSHRNESRLVVEFFKHRCDVERWTGNDSNKDLLQKTISDLFLKRAAIPMGDGVNAGLGEEYANFCTNSLKTAPDATTLSRIETNRRLESKHFGFLVTHEDDIDVALKMEAGVSNRDGIDRVLAANSDSDTDADNRIDATAVLSKWKRILNQESGSDSTGCWMALGGPHTANAFVKYAQACIRYRSPRGSYNDETIDEEEKKNESLLAAKIKNMSLSIYERGVAECPTVESIWLSYLQQLNYLIEQTEVELREANRAESTAATEAQTTDIRQRRSKLLADASAVVDRAIRNCPYSTELVKVKLVLVLRRVNAGMLVLDPENLMTELILKETLANGFVVAESGENGPAAALELFGALLDIVRKRILFLLAEFDQTKVTTTTTNSQKKRSKTTVTTTLQYDDPESIQGILSPNKANPGDASNGKRMSDYLLQELEDLCIDLREIFDEAESYLRKNQGKFSNKTSIEDGRAALAKEKALTETHLVAPLLRTIQFLQSQNDNELETRRAAQSKGRETLAGVLRHHDKAAKIVQPIHPSVYLSYIQALTASNSVVSTILSFPTDVLANLRRLRFLYQKALKSVGKPKDRNKNVQTSSAGISEADELDYETSLRCLCRDYLMFERHFGSARSYEDCAKSIQKKMAKTFALNRNNNGTGVATTIVNEDSTAIPMDLDNSPSSTMEIPDEATQKRKREVDDEPRNQDEESPSGKDLLPPTKRKKEESDKVQTAPKSSELAEKVSNPTTFKEIEEAKGNLKHPKHKVKVGNLEYPAHPFTVKVSFLSPNTEDMDLVDVLRPKCGAVVHAKIMREKHHHHGKKGKSKGWALVQFEERESVEKALALSDVIGIHMKSVRIERSHLPAVGLVPAGLHRVNPKGEGKSTKRNLHKRKEQHDISKKGSNYAPTEKGETNGPPVEGKAKPSRSSTKSTGSSSGASIFAFRPRGVASNMSRKRKSKINISEQK